MPPSILIYVHVTQSWRRQLIHISKGVVAGKSRKQLPAPVSTFTNFGLLSKTFHIVLSYFFSKMQYFGLSSPIFV